MIFRRAAWLAAILLLAADALMQVRGGWQGDKEWLLLAARKVLEGKALGDDIFEVDPPFIVWLFTVPVWLSIHLPVLEDYQVLALIGLAASGLSAWIGMRLVRWHPAFAESAHRRLLLGLLVAYTLIFFATPIYFFDRDHIFFVLVFPYLLRFMPSLAPAKISLRLRVLIGLLAGVGFCIKPYTAIVFVILQLMILRRSRSLAAVWNLENCIIVSAAVLYLLCVWYFAPYYIHTIIPMAMATYSGFNRRVNGYLFVTVALISAGLTFADFRPRYKTPYRPDVYYFAGVCIAFLIYALAGNGWGYTYNPLLCTLLFLSGWVMMEYRWLLSEAKNSGLPFSRFLFGMQACLFNLGINAVYILLCIGTFFFGSPCGSATGCQPDPYAQYIKVHQIRSFSTMSMDLRRWTSLVRQTHTQWGSRFNSLWMLPQIMIGGPQFVASYRWIVDYVSNAYAEDLEKYKPDIVFVDISDGIFDYPYPVDIPGLLESSPQFGHAWSEYRRVDTIDVCGSPAKKPDPHQQPKDAASRQIHIDCRFDIYARGR